MVAHLRQRTVFLCGTLFLLGVAAYLCFSLLWLAPAPRPWRLGLTALLLLLSQGVIGMRALTLWKPKTPRRVLLTGGFLSSTFMVLSWLVLVRDAVLVLLLLLAWLQLLPGMAAVGYRTFYFSIPFELGMTAASFVLAALGLYRALRAPRVVKTRLVIPRLPKALVGLQLVHLSDLHIGSTFPKAWLETVVNRVNALKADFVFITGDLADAPPELAAEDLHALARLRAKYGVLLCPGNHDYESGLRPWISLWRSWGLEPLINEHRVFHARGETVIVGAVADPSAARFPGCELPNIRQTFQGAPKGFRILLSHRPGEAKENAALGCQLQLSGHTHGGQFFFLLPLVSRLNKGFLAGVYHVGPMLLHVCPGTGMWGYAPMRLGVPAEISLLELACENASPADKPVL